MAEPVQIRNSRLRRIAVEFREGILGGQPATDMCAIICVPLQAYLACCCGVQTKLIEGKVGEASHCWLELPDGLILDPTIDQFPVAAKEHRVRRVYVGHLPASYRACSRTEITPPVAVAPPGKPSPVWRPLYATVEEALAAMSVNSQIRRLIARDGLACHWCKRTCDPRLSKTADLYPTREHVQRRADGGRSVMENLVIACRKCNNTRHSFKWKPGANL